MMMMVGRLLVALALVVAAANAAGDNIYTYGKSTNWKYDDCPADATDFAAECALLTECTNDIPAPLTEDDWDWETLDGRRKSQTDPSVWRPSSNQRDWLGELDLWGNRGGKWMDAGYLQVRDSGWYRLYDTLFAESCSKQLNEAAYFRIRNLCNCDGYPRFGNWETPTGEPTDWWVQQGMEQQQVWLVPDLDNHGDSTPCRSCNLAGECETTQLDAVCANPDISVLGTVEESNRDFLFTGQETTGGGVGLEAEYVCGNEDHGDGCCAPPPKGHPSAPADYRGVAIGEFFLVGAPRWNRVEMYHACMHFHDESSPRDDKNAYIGPVRQAMVDDIDANYLLGYGDVIKGNDRYPYCRGSVESVHYTPDLQTFENSFDPCPVTPTPSIGAPPSESTTPTPSNSPTVSESATPTVSETASPTAMPTTSLTRGALPSQTATRSPTPSSSQTGTTTGTPSASLPPVCPEICLDCFQLACAEECDPIVRFCEFPADEIPAFDCSDTACLDCVKRLANDPSLEPCPGSASDLQAENVATGEPCICNDGCYPWAGGTGNESCLIGLVPPLVASSSDSLNVGAIVGSTIAGAILLFALVVTAIAIIIFRKQIASVLVPGYNSQLEANAAHDNALYGAPDGQGTNPMFSRSSK